MQINGKRKELPLSFLAASPLSPHEYSRSTVLKKKEKYGTVGADKPRAKTSREKIWAERFLLAPMPSRLAPFAAQMKACSQVGVEFTTFFFQVVLLSLFLARYAVNTKLGMNTAG